jgi:formate dehydrogenase subunit gamma
MAPLTIHRPRGNLFLAPLLIVVLICALFPPAYAEDASNPRADFWRLARQGTEGYTSVSSEGHDVLINSDAEIWREFRNVLLIKISPWLMGVVLIIIGLFHLIVGGDKLMEPRSGVTIERYSLFERIVHWYTALFFIILAITGLSMLLGRVSLIPVVGHGPFAVYLGAAKIVHNISGPFFLAGIFLEFVVWVRDNLLHKSDLGWFGNLGGMVGKGPRPHTEKVSGGEKMWFWLLVIFGILVGVTGVLLDFPIWEQTRFTMQLSLAVHATVAVLFITASFGHIYMGTIGVEGAFEGMWQGRVDKVWARQHADLWYERVAREDEQAG